MASGRSGKSRYEEWLILPLCFPVGPERQLSGKRAQPLFAALLVGLAPDLMPICDCLDEPTV